MNDAAERVSSKVAVTRRAIGRLVMFLQQRAGSIVRVPDDSGAGGDKRVYQDPEVVPGIVAVALRLYLWNARVPSDQ